MVTEHSNGEKVAYLFDDVWKIFSHGESLFLISILPHSKVSIEWIKVRQ